jgi:hypothetical protein
LTRADLLKEQQALNDYNQLAGEVRRYAGPPVDPREEGDLLHLLLATAGAAFIALASAGLGYLFWWVCNQPPIFWNRVAAVAVVVLGLAVVAFGLLGYGRAQQGRR